MKKRILFLSVFLLLLVVEICIAMFGHDSFIRPYIGDVLVTVLLCCLVRCFLPNRPRHLAIYVFLFSAVVELSQLAELADKLGIKSSVLRAVLGTTFDWKDIFCYFCGCALFYAAEMKLISRSDQAAWNSSFKERQKRK